MIYIYYHKNTPSIIFIILITYWSYFFVQIQKYHDQNQTKKDTVPVYPKPIRPVTKSTTINLMRGKEQGVIQSNKLLQRKKIMHVESTINNIAKTALRNPKNIQYLGTIRNGNTDSETNIIRINQTVFFLKSGQPHDSLLILKTSNEELILSIHKKRISIKKKLNQ